MTGQSPEHDVSGITDPFLQVGLTLFHALNRDASLTSPFSDSTGENITPIAIAG